MAQRNTSRRNTGRRKGHEDFEGWHPVLKRSALPVAVLMAVAGVIWYAASPGLESYQASGLLLLPLACFVLYWCSKLLPTRVQWILAIGLTPVGPIGYLIAQNDQWWNWGQLTPVPLIVLGMARSMKSSDLDPDREPWSGGLGDGPLGPP